MNSTCLCRRGGAAACWRWRWRSTAEPPRAADSCCGNNGVGRVGSQRGQGRKQEGGWPDGVGTRVVESRRGATEGGVSERDRRPRDCPALLCPALFCPVLVCSALLPQCYASGCLSCPAGLSAPATSACQPPTAVFCRKGHDGGGSRDDSRPRRVAGRKHGVVSGLWGTGEWAYGHGHGAEARRDACRYRSPLGRNSAVDRIWGRRGARGGRLGIRRRLVHVMCWRWMAR